MRNKSSVFDNLILHLHPRLVPEQTLNFTLTWGLGGMSLVLVLLLALTGILLMFVCEPVPGQAYESIITLHEKVLFGTFIRNIHHWSGNILVIVSFLAVHVIIMPLSLFLLMPYHFWFVRKARGVVVPPPSRDRPEGEDVYVPTIPNLTTRELAAGLTLIAFVMVYAIIFDAPLDAKANPGLSPNPTKAPWFFIGIQEMLIHFHPLFAAWVIPLLIALALIILPICITTRILQAYGSAPGEGSGWGLSRPLPPSWQLHLP